ncbi:ROK family protein [Glycomyces harbinensis]|uniref:Sugar kinase of the NBD/HSP70 family, may contain an N-terminal HTH domain n=1 Tax=Glycomyces harbinensis TaxID=58114 RepID=A0A1G7CEB0_9ACTN|nr:ROK family protein [Glycomyces harbinensis]SDE37678.1 Sugar kinase of the NBD/HSP70 family, may contain an N-terminal HTH domain [Glycomyces harbinensis]
MTDGLWSIYSEYTSVELSGDVNDAARMIFNLVNIDGSRSIGVDPPLVPELKAELLRLDPGSTWARWWSKHSGSDLRVVAGKKKPAVLPLIRRREQSPSGRVVGVNIGGHNLRTVFLEDGKMLDSRRLRIGSGQISRLANITLRDLVSLLDISAFGPEKVGIAWSAPRVNGSLRSSSIQLENAGEVGRLLDLNEIDSALSQELRCRASSWNDGEAIAAAEISNRSTDGKGQVLSIKLGTSIAAGFSIGSDIVSAPLQLSKLLLRASPMVEFDHPIIGVRGTSRDVLGATSLAQAYQAITGASGTSYKDYCELTVAGDPVATELTRRAAAGIAEIAQVMTDAFGSFQLAVTGDNISDEVYSAVFERFLTAELANVRGVRLLSPGIDSSLGAAIGAAVLAQEFSISHY